MLPFKQNPEKGGDLLGKWPKLKRDWSLEPKRYPGTPPVPRDVVLRIKAARGEDKPNPFTIMIGGLRDGDHLFIDWMDDKELWLNGCRVAAYRDGVLLRWAPAGWLRDVSGKCLYAPYLRSLSSVMSFIDMMAMACGYTTVLKEETVTCRRFVLETVAGESRRLLPGDQLRFDWCDKTLQVERRQGTVDMNL
ncbi:MAG: hypothetical protein NTX96_01880, partial [Candidatus Zambryskibacteria bacterium]|nr:hypothetical protein [Candidatus Zambryskibacteria bacterium]